MTVQFNLLNAVFLPIQRNLQQHASKIVVALVAISAFAIAYALYIKRTISATPLTPKVTVPAQNTPKADIPDFSKLKAEIVAEINKTLQEKIDAAIKPKFDAIASEKNKQKEEIVAEINKTLQDKIDAAINPKFDAIASEKKKQEEKAAADLINLKTEITTKIKEEGEAVLQKARDSVVNAEPLKQIKETSDHKQEAPKPILPVQTPGNNNSNKVEILKKGNTTLLDEFAAKGIHFHFATEVEIEIYKDDLFKLPQKNYIVMYVATCRLQENRSQELDIIFQKTAKNPVILIFNRAGIHSLKNVEPYELGNKNKKTCLVVPLLYCNSSIRAFNQHMIELLRKLLPSE